MQTESEIIVFQKAAMYDLIEILESDPDKTYTAFLFAKPSDNI